MTCAPGFRNARAQTEVGHDLLAPPGEAAGHSARLDPPRFIPVDPEEVGAPLHRALAEHIDGEALEESRELVPWFRPGDADLFRAVGGGLHARHVGHNPGGELTRVQVRPAPGFLVIPGGPGLTLRTQEGAVARGDRHLLPLHIEIHVDHRPRRVSPRIAR